MRRAAIVDVLKSYLAKGVRRGIGQRRRPAPPSPPSPRPHDGNETERHDHHGDDHAEASGKNRPTALRTHLCGVLSRADMGAEVRLCGWVARRPSTGSTSLSSTSATTRGSSSASSTTLPTRARMGGRRHGTVRARPEARSTRASAPGRSRSATAPSRCSTSPSPRRSPSTTGSSPTSPCACATATSTSAGPVCSATWAPLPGQLRHPGSHGAAGLRRDRDPDSVGADAGGIAGVLRPPGCTTATSTRCPRVLSWPSSCSWWEV